MNDPVKFDLDETDGEIPPEDLANDIRDILNDPRCEGYDGLTVNIERKPQ